MILVLLALLISAVVFQLARQDQYLCSETALSNCPVFLGQALVYFVLSVSLLLSVSYLVRRIGAVSCEHERKFRLYELVFKTIDAGIIVLDRSGIVQFINPLCMKILGGDPTRFAQGIHFSGLIEPVLVPVYDKITAALENRDSFTREYRVFMSDGIRCYLCSFYTSFVGEQEPAYIISLSDRTREDEIRQKLSEQLEETHRYAVSKDNFFANMSHEIRTPINAILGMTYFAKMGSVDQKTQDYIQKIENASELLLGVVNDILDFSKMQEHKFSLKPENFNLFDLKKILYDLFSLKARQKGLDFNVEFDCQDPFIVFGDQFRLTQIFMNLVNNAVKFTDEGFVSVSLNHETVGKDIILRCTVRDTGCGLSEDDMAKLFIDYEQFGQVLEKSHEGTGLGLAICKRLVELMHGVIWVDSTLNTGSSFHFVVVLHRPELLHPGEDHQTLPLIHRKTGRALVVDDNEINREISASLLAECGFVTEHAVDGLDALELCRLRDPGYYDLILMDIHMPRMNGYDSAKIMRSELTISCPILAVTATSDGSQGLETNREVFSGFLLKPFSPGLFKSLFASQKGLHT